MRRRAKPAKTKVEGKRPLAPGAPRADGARVRDPEKRLAETLKSRAEALEQLQTRDPELADSLEQQTATAEILRVIASSPTDLQPLVY